METLEDAAKNKYPIENTGAMFMPNRHEVTNIYKQEAFIDGANWQAKRMYSEDGLVRFMQFIVSQESLQNTSSVSETTVMYYIEQFKKK